MVGGSGGNEAVVGESVGGVVLLKSLVSRRCLVVARREVMGGEGREGACVGLVVRMLVRNCGWGVGRPEVVRRLVSCAARFAVCCCCCWAIRCGYE